LTVGNVFWACVGALLFMDVAKVVLIVLVKLLRDEDK